MGEVFRFLRQNESWIYLILGAVVFVYLIRLLKAWRDYRSSNFGLEKEIVQRRVSSAIAITAVSILFILTEFVLVTFVAPNLANIQMITTPTIDLMITPSPTLLQATPTTNFSLEVLPTGTSVATGNGCVAQRLEWLSPRSGDAVRGTVTLEGTVNFVNMGFYKYEYSQVGSDIWNPIAAGNTRVVEGPLGGPWNTSQLSPGDYRLRIIATDNNDNPFPACEITITILVSDE